jgi:hypothetical protein
MLVNRGIRLRCNNSHDDPWLSYRYLYSIGVPVGRKPEAVRRSHRSFWCWSYRSLSVLYGRINQRIWNSSSNIRTIMEYGNEDDRSKPQNRRTDDGRRGSCDGPHVGWHVARIHHSLTEHIVCHSFKEHTWDDRKKHTRGYQNDNYYSSDRTASLRNLEEDWKCLEVKLCLRILHRTPVHPIIYLF